MATRRKASDIDKTAQPALVHEIERSEVSIPAPGIRFHALSKDGDQSTAAVMNRTVTRQQQASIHYEMFRSHPTIRAAIEKIAKTAVSTGYMFAGATPGEAVPEAEKRELTLFFRRSNGAKLLRSTYKDLLIFGDAYWWIQPTRGERPFKAMRLHPAFVEIKATGAEVTEYVYGGMATTGESDGQKAKRYPAKEVIHFALEDPASDLYGLSLLASLEPIVAVDLFAIQYNGKFFENSAQTGTIFSLKSTDAGEIARNREYLEQNYVGTDNAHKPLLLEGEIEVKKSVSTAQEMQFIEGRKLLREEMLEVLDVPKEKLGITEDSNRSVGKESDNTFRSECISPLQLVVEEEINNALILTMFGFEDALFQHNEVSTRDSLELTKLYAELERMGVFSIDEIRDRVFGLPGVEGGDKHFVQTAAGVIPVEMLDEVANRLLTAQGGLGGNAMNQGPTNPAQPRADQPQREAE